MSIGIQMIGIMREDSEVNLKLKQSMLMILVIGTATMKEDSALRLLTSLLKVLGKTNTGTQETGNMNEIWFKHKESTLDLPSSSQTDYSKY